ncbi:MAG: nitrilase-related carbon-nitrogen hydrolase, partial [Paraglaciecola sp.]|uniref:nitrilase-related carbon-nitrogen hydrolase n=1 Tax=Paraglaciecola sp. TaxID=1920173 RepID=UPI003297FA52
MSNLVAIQMNSSNNVEENLLFIEQQLQNVLVERPCLVVLPECFACFGANEHQLLHIAEDLGHGPIQSKLMALAKQNEVWLVAGSMPITCNLKEKYTASCLLIDSDGQLVEEYQKIHLFDVQVADNTGSYFESRDTQAGNKLVVVNTPFGILGLAICYDIR